MTTTTLYRRKVEPVRARIPSLAQVLLIPDSDDALPPDTHDFDALLRGASEAFATVATRPDDAALLHFGDKVGAKVEKNGKYFLAVNGKGGKKGYESLWSPVFSPDGSELLVRCVNNGKYCRRIVPVNEI